MLRRSHVTTEAATLSTPLPLHALGHNKRSRRKPRCGSRVCFGPQPFSSQMQRRKAVCVIFLTGVFLVLYHAYNSRFVSILSKDPVESSGVIGQRNGTHVDTSDANKNVSPLFNPIDYEGFTIRINTWKREEQLQISLEHHVTCNVVTRVQVVWCVEQGEPPPWLQALHDDYDSKVVVERHVANSLNERFNMLLAPPTRGILSMDDDVLRPCLALEVGFRAWVRNPDRLVGYDARTHVIDDKSSRWKYGYKSTTDRENHYSLTLLRYAFVHRDHLTSYMTQMPAEIRDRVAKHFNCEDIAMSLWVSSRDRSSSSSRAPDPVRPPLLADQWAMQSMVKLYSPAGGISGTSDHKKLRDACVHDFARILNVQQLSYATLVHDHRAVFECGDAAENWNVIPATITTFAALDETMEAWRHSRKLLNDQLGHMRQHMSLQAYQRGLIEGGRPWKERFGQDRHHHEVEHDSSDTASKEQNIESS